MSQERVLMSKKAVEIQEQWKPRNGDICFFNDDIWIVGNWYDDNIVRYYPPEEQFDTFDGGHEWESKMEFYKAEAIWLPRQCQLQEMLTGNSLILVDVIKSFVFHSPGVDASWSMEQLWLACVMYKKFNKRWNGEDWIINA